MQTTLPFLNDDTENDSFESILYSSGIDNISFEFSLRMKKSWRITKKGNQYTVTAPAPFENSDPETKRTLIHWAEIMRNSNLSRKRLSHKEQFEVKHLEKKLWQYIHGEDEATRYRSFHQPHRRFKDACGLHYDLNEQFSKLNNYYFEGTLTSFLRWGKHGSKTSYHTQIVDETQNRHHLITIAGFYNLPNIPEFALNGVLYHEMCHIAAPPREGDRRRNVHHKEFRLLEKQYRHYEEWQTWLKKDAQKILRSMRWR